MRDTQVLCTADSVVIVVNREKSRCLTMVVVTTFLSCCFLLRRVKLARRHDRSLSLDDRQTKKEGKKQMRADYIFVVMRVLAAMTEAIF